MPLKQDKPASAPAERALIQQIRRRQGNKSFPGMVLGIGDDCALLQPEPREQIVVTTDLSIEGRHFRLEWHPPEVVGHRTLTRGLSDLAAMGARPLAAFLSLGLPPELIRPARRKRSWLDRFLDGFFALAKEHHTPLAGGDLAQSPVATADIVLVGAVPRNRALLRSRARPGDLLYVTGTLGGAANGLNQLTGMAGRSGKLQPGFSLSKASGSLDSHLHPQPRVAQGQWLQKHRAATAAIDLSDGLSTDLAHLCEESGVAAEINAAHLPIAPGATRAQALHGGEDYELLFTARAGIRVPRSIAGVPVAQIGRIVRRRSSRPMIALLTEGSALAIEPHGWQHFE